MDKNIYASLHSLGALAMGASCVAGGFTLSAASQILLSSKASIAVVQAGMALTATAWLIGLNFGNLAGRALGLNQCSPKAIFAGCASGLITALVTSRLRLGGMLLCEPFVPHLTLAATIGTAYWLAKQSYEQQNS